MNPTSTDSAGVWFPPPLVYLVALIAGILLGRILPGTMPHTALLNAVGVALLVLGLVLMISARVLLVRRGTNVNPARPTTALVADGPYRLTRNPMYVGAAAFYSGIALLFASLWALIFLVPVLVIIRYLVIAKEELYLQGKFGDEYRRYTGLVRRWI